MNYISQIQQINPGLGLFIMSIVYLMSKFIEWHKELKNLDKNKKNIDDIVIELDDLLKNINKNIINMSNSINNINNLTIKIFDMHNVKDYDQVPVWYVKQSLIDAISRIDRKLTKLIGFKDNESQ